MKKLFILTASIFMLSTANIKAQIILDNILDSVDRGTDFYMAQISLTETKYVFLDTVTNTFSLYNMDFTPFLTNIAVPEPFAMMTAFMQPIYITRALFDCDTSNIEYAYEAPVNSYRKPFYIMRTDGTQLFKLDSANGPYCLGGCMGMSDIIVPIKNTSDGTKLWLQRTDLPGIYIYSLCGTLPEDVFDFTVTKQSYIKIFPNPTASTLTFQINPPDNMNEYQLVIVDNNGKEVKREKNISNTHYTIDVTGFSNGMYYYSLCTKNKSYQAGKFIITK